MVNGIFLYLYQRFKAQESTMTNKDQHPAILYKYIDTTGGLSMLQKEELWFRRTGFLNDPYDCYLSHECQGKYPEFSVSFDLNELTKYFGICSLSETATTFLMWSYYNEHKGMCIGVNMKDIYTSLINHFHDKINSYLSFRKVVYKNKLPDLNLINIVPFDYQTPRIDNTPSKKAQNEINGFLSTKAKWWEHEKEYRLILRQTPNPYLNLDEPVKLQMRNLINRVYLGCKFDGNIDTIINIEKEKNDVYKFRQQSHTYGLYAEKLYSHNNQ
ncbi:DUF2971 domain-containing protein [Alistipes finegoldii]|uniref:DUF2971 domain-containing protein n=1 Tax=Alistipes finegoldii TaxID=214856 RepID=UPI002431AB42|nr:DUF2971 domain-containing protein [Alistipes finegoldii]